MRFLKYSLWKKLLRWFKFQYLKVMRTAATPYSIAMGMAVGIFIGFLPIIPLQTICTIVLCLLLRGNAVVGFIGTLISNPLNWVPFYYCLYIVGKAIVPWNPPDMNLEQFGALISDLDVRQFMTLGKELLAAFKIMLIAGLALGSVGSVVAFFATHKAVRVFRKNRAMKILKNRTRM